MNRHATVFRIPRKRGGGHYWAVLLEGAGVDVHLYYRWTNALAGAISWTETVR